MRDAGQAHSHGSLSAAPLSPASWPDFDRLFAAHGGVWGGCWCMFFHRPGQFDARAYAKNRGAKRSLVTEGKAHGTIVYCGGDPVGWCQYGPREELARIDRKRGYVPTADHPWRITCLFTARGHRRSGIAKFAVAESLGSMKRLGAETVEAYPVEGVSSSSLLWAGTPHLFENAGFQRKVRLGKKRWIYSLKVRRPGKESRESTS